MKNTIIQQIVEHCNHIHASS